MFKFWKQIRISLVTKILILIHKNESKTHSLLKKKKELMSKLHKTQVKYGQFWGLHSPMAPNISGSVEAGKQTILWT